MRLNISIAIPAVIVVLAIALLIWMLAGNWLSEKTAGSNMASNTASSGEQSSVPIAQADDPAAVIVARRDEIYNDPDSPLGGNPAGDVTIVEFFDYNCPYCRQVASVLVELQRSDPNLRFVYKEFPILGPDSDLAARAALAARRQGKYLEFHNAMMMSRFVANHASVMQVAEIAGLDVERLKADMEDPGLEGILARNLALARALRIDATPSFVIADQVYAGVAKLAGFQQAIAAERERLAQ
jgi:protein-disulfide isomerase